MLARLLLNKVSAICSALFTPLDRQCTALLRSGGFPSCDQNSKKKGRPENSSRLGSEPVRALFAYTRARCWSRVSGDVDNNATGAFIVLASPALFPAPDPGVSPSPVHQNNSFETSFDIPTDLLAHGMPTSQGGSRSIERLLMLGVSS
jgi:hypothetical protein